VKNWTWLETLQLDHHSGDVLASDKEKSKGKWNWGAEHRAPGGGQGGYREKLRKTFYVKIKDG